MARVWLYVELNPWVFGFQLWNLWPCFTRFFDEYLCHACDGIIRGHIEYTNMCWISCLLFVCVDPRSKLVICPGCWCSSPWMAMTLVPKQSFLPIQIYIKYETQKPKNPPAQNHCRFGFSSNKKPFGTSTGLQHWHECTRMYKGFKPKMWRSPPSHFLTNVHFYRIYHITPSNINNQSIPTPP